MIMTKESKRPQIDESIYKRGQAWYYQVFDRYFETADVFLGQYHRSVLCGDKIVENVRFLMTQDKDGFVRSLDERWVELDLIEERDNIPGYSEYLAADSKYWLFKSLEKEGLDSTEFGIERDNFDPSKIDFDKLYETYGVNGILVTAFSCCVASLEGRQHINNYLYELFDRQIEINRKKMLSGFETESPETDDLYNQCNLTDSRYFRTYKSQEEREYYVDLVRRRYEL